MNENFAFEMSFEKYVIHVRTCIHECDEDASLLWPVVECHHRTPQAHSASFVGDSMIRYAPAARCHLFAIIPNANPNVDFRDFVWMYASFHFVC